MKNIITVLLLAFLFSVSFYSCKKKRKEDPAPVVAPEPTPPKASELTDGILEGLISLDTNFIPSVTEAYKVGSSMNILLSSPEKALSVALSIDSVRIGSFNKPNASGTFAVFSLSPSNTYSTKSDQASSKIIISDLTDETVSGDYTLIGVNYIGVKKTVSGSFNISYKRN